MSRSAAALRLRAVVLGALALLVVLGSGLGTGRADADPPAPTTIALTITPGGPVRTDTPVVYRADVSPATATGRVLFTFEQSGTAMAYADCIDGVSVVLTKLHQLGTQLVTARFVPDNPTTFAASTSAAVPLVVSLSPTVTVATSTGSVLSPGARVAPAQQLQARIAGFLPGSRASVAFDGSVIVPSIGVGGDTRGSAAFVVPVGLAVGTHALVVRSGSLSASVQVVVTSPTTAVIVPVPAAATSAPAAGTPPAPAPAPTSSSAGIPDTGTRPALAQTGGDPLDLGLGALLLVGAGLLLLRVQPVHAGAHARSGGAHAAGKEHLPGRHRAA